MNTTPAFQVPSFRFGLCGLALLLLLLVCVGCRPAASDKAEGRSTVAFHTATGLQTLNPFLAKDNDSRLALALVFQPLVGIDYYSGKCVPVLVDALAPVAPDSSAKANLKLSYRLRPDARFHNGQPVRVGDVVFSLKALLAMGNKAAHLQPYFQYIAAIEPNDKDSLGFTIVCVAPYYAAESALADLFILPEAVYDPKGLLRDIPLASLREDKTDTAPAASLQAFVEGFIAPPAKDGHWIGSGAYHSTAFDPNGKCTFLRQANWWGEAHQAEHHWFEAYAQEISFVTIKDSKTALTALLEGEINAMRNIPARDFALSLQDNQEAKQKLHLATPEQYVIGFIGLNMRHPLLSDPRLRIALCSAMPIEDYIRNAFYDLAVPVTGPIHPSNQTLLNSSIKGIPYNPEIARQLLVTAGWKDSNGNGIADNVLEGKRMELELEMLTVQGSTANETAALLLQENAGKLGINISIRPLDHAAMKERLAKGQFALYTGSWALPPDGGDPKQIWHTEAQKGGGNYFGFGSTETDALIEKIRQERDLSRRAPLWKELQVAIHAATPCISLSAASNRIAISKKFAQPRYAAMSPGFWLPALSPK